MSQNSFRRNSSRRLQRALSVAAAASLALGFALVASPASAAPGDEHLAGLEYVALGDSYAAGFGLTPLTGVPAPECAQSSLNYPHLTATELGLTLTDVTCSGAETVNLTTTPQLVAPATTVPLQNDALGASTDIVTVTIGGNDLGFVDILTNCAALSAAGPVIAGTTDCTTFYNTGGTDQLADAIAGPVATALQGTFAAIAAAAPNAKIFVVGYPSLTPSVLPTAGCFRDAAGTLTPPFPINGYPYVDADVTYLHSIEVLLDDALATAAANNGATYISNLAGTDAHSPCSTVDPYVNGITVTSFTASPLAVTLAPGAMHPNAAGASYLATQLEDAIRVAFPAPEPDAEPAGPALAVTGAESAVWLIAIAGGLVLVGGLVMVLRLVGRRRTRE